MMFARADETAGDIPVKDITVSPNGAATLPEALLSQNVRERQNVSKFSREELEDKFLRLQDENLTLKQHTCKQEDKIRRMATKLIRLVKDRKQSEGGRVVGSRDVEMEEMMEELQEKVQDLEKQNEGLKRRLLATKQQLQVQSRRHTPYSHIQPRINSGLRRLRDVMPMASSRPHTPKAGIGPVEGDLSAKPPQGLLPRYGHSLLDEARAEIRNLENIIESQQAQMEELERSAEMLRDQLKRKEREFEESLLQMREHQASGQRLTIKDNVEMIKLQKLLSEKANTLTVLEGRFLQQQESMKTLKASHDAALVKVDEVSRQLKEERLKSLQLETQIQTRALDQRRTQELQERIQDLEKEKDLLKENCDKLVKSAFDVSQEQKWKTREQQLKLQVAQLEMALKSDLGDKNQILDKIKTERDLNEKLMQENRELQLRYLEQKQQLDEIKERMKYFTKESEIDAAELSEALMLIKVRRSQKSGELGFLEKVEEDVKVDVERSLRELQASHAETIQELEKTRNMLIIQHKINKDYQGEVEAVTRAMDDLKLEHEMKAEKMAQLLDMRAAKIKKLEAQLKDIAYGTKTHVFRPDVTSDDVTDEFDESLRLARGENLLEIHLGKAQFSPEAVESLKDKDPSTFCTYAFYDFELQSTAVVRGTHPAYSLTSQYLVRVDDLFLNYLHSSSVTVEVQLAEGLSFRTVAAGQLRLNQLLERDGKVFGTIQLVGVTDEIQVFGALEYWLKLRVPMEQAIRLYKERVKALGYLNTSMRDSQALVPSSPSLMDGDLNELNITIHSCCDLRSRGPHTQPSPYIIYKLYHFPDHDTPIISSTNEPQFEDHMVFPVAMNSDLDALLRSEALVFYVFDDLDVENQLYLGKARVPLISLAHDKTITGMFELTDPEGRPSGQISVTLKWKFPYLPPTSSAITTLQTTTPDRQTSQNKEKTHTETQPMTRDPPLIPQPTMSEAPMPKPRQRTLPKSTAKRVSFVDVTELERKMDQTTASDEGDDEEPKSTLTPAPKSVLVMEAGEATAISEEEDEEESHFSEGQVITASSQSDESEISEELQEPLADIQGEDDDSDDCIVPAQSSQHKKQPSECIRVEIVSMSLKPGSRVAEDGAIVRLFVEYSFLGLPSVETPLSLKKPLPGHSVSYNFSNVIHVDKESNQLRRQTLRTVLEGRNRQLEHIKFTVVSDPPEEEEQDEECEDVGVAYLRILDIMEKHRDMKDVSLNVVDVQDSSEVVGHLVVTVEALEALTSIMKDPERDQTLTTLA
ncbi:protein fantom [Carassius auratus]|uniref:Protein fantom n=1 Tax=Carassius auratus TaxID=7957 RepID=A0A6P6MFL5_CARAU|nr:protein fantom [Carassius auratus]XP_026095321.1 protein fantom [Carassius auratus]XP_026095322.1 protein fantom [Carassius auratus]XP_026095323.1 protein fantom [Carassius auratus]XP_026095324.1 protein fantom [Carassius auratus]